MSEKHTQGRLQVVNHYSDEVSIIDSRGFEIVEVPNMPILLGYQEKLGISHWADRPGEAILELEPEDQAAIARRLVACWNACEGIGLERLEDLGKPLIKHLIGCDERAARQVKQVEELEDKCAGMAIALRGAREFIGHDRETVIQGCTVDDVFMPDDQSARAIAEYDAILADIDAALPPKPAPAVVHLPSDDTEGGAL